MRLLRDVPTMTELFDRITKGGSVDKLLSLYNSKPTDSEGRYLHWEKVRYLPTPDGMTQEEVWAGMKMARMSLLKSLPFVDTKQKPFKFATPDSVLKMLHNLDRNASGQIKMLEPVTNPATRDMYLVNSLIEEAINSSQLEGASTTRKVAKEMIKQNRKPKNRSEQMIFNNYLAMSFIRDHVSDKLTPEIIFELHRIVTDKTLDDDTAAGKFRTDNDIFVLDASGEQILHVPPKFEELPERLKILCDFANEKEAGIFIHPVIRAILLHFMLAYDHPFVDGNGRTARALFYWAMAKQGYWLIEFTSISRILKNAPAKYGYAFLYTETDDNDTTYFLIHQLKVILGAIEELHTYLYQKIKSTKKAVELLNGTKLVGKVNHRQVSILENALRNPNSTYRTNEHQNTHRISYQTARTDLLHLSDELKLLIKAKEGRAFVFFAPSDLQERIDSMK